MGIGSEAISLLERGVVELSVVKLMQLADIFDCRMDELLTELSNRLNDQGQMIAGLLSGLKESAPAFILATHLANK
ncbi:hypothetical protein [Pseudomonas sp. DR48]|nr:hypothetical protein [Pseudomonas sp. DR48]